MSRTLAVQYHCLGMGGTAIEQSGHNVNVPLLESDEQRRGSIRLQDATRGEFGALSVVNQASHGGATHDTVSWTPAQLDAETWLLRATSSLYY
jgi:hypothetical protein